MKGTITIEFEIPGDDFYKVASLTIPYYEALRKVPAPEGLTIEHFTMTDGKPRRTRKAKAATVKEK